jgi:hypothetical protein
MKISLCAYGGGATSCIVTTSAPGSDIVNGKTFPSFQHLDKELNRLADFAHARRLRMLYKLSVF